MIWNKSDAGAFVTFGNNVLMVSLEFWQQGTSVKILVIGNLVHVTSNWSLMFIKEEM